MMRDAEFERYVRKAFRQMEERGAHPSLEDIADLAAGKGAGPAHEELVSHVAGCRFCQERLQDFDQFMLDCERPGRDDLFTDQELNNEWQKLRRRMRWRNALTTARTWIPLPSFGLKWAGAVAAILVVITATWFGIAALRPSPAKLLARAYTERRTIEYRVAGASYAPVRVERGAGSTFNMPEALLKATARIAEEIKSKPEDPDVLRLEAEADMITRQAGAAVQTLQKALDFSPQNPRILADLGAAYALRGDLERQPADYPNALEYMSRSLRIEPGNREVMFNRALVLERMLLKDQAVAAWQQYLKLDSTSDWAKEARKHLAELKAVMRWREDLLRTIVDDPDRFLALSSNDDGIDAEAWFRDIAVTKWLPRANSDARAREALHRLAQILKERHGDSWLAEMEAGGFRAESTPGALWARYQHVVDLRIQLRSEECVPLAAALIRDLDAHEYKWLQAQTRVEYADCAMRVGRLKEAAPRMREALEISRGAAFGDVALRAGSGYLETIRFVGLPSEMFAKAEEFLAIFWSGAYSSVRFQQIIDILRDIARHSDQKYAAWFLARSVLWAADATHNPRIQGPAHANLAVASQAIGEDGDARANLKLADAFYVGLPGGYRLRPQTFLAHVEMDRGDVDAALRRLEALRIGFDARASIQGVSEYYQVLGTIYLRKHSLSEAANAFQKSIEYGNRTITSVSSERERAGALKIIEDSYRGLAAATIGISRDPAESLRVWRSFRTLDAVGSFASMRPAHGPVLSFLELADGFVAWFSRDDRVVFHDLRVSGAAVATAAARFRRECSDPASAGRGFREDAELLYRWLIEPFAAEFSDQDRELTLELDGALAGIPFQAMMSPDGRYLADRFTVVLSSGYSNREVITPGPDAAVVVVANPAVIGESAARFPSLPDALKEADVVRANFRNTKVLTSHDATMEALAPLLPRAEIFHFAGHGYSDSENGALLLAANDPKTADYDLLRSADLQQQNWTRCRIAVLSACAAASGEVEGPHNPDSLVRALTRAGVPRIAASLWNVESGATTELMRCFYQSLAKGASPSEALRAAQQAVRSHPDWSHPYYWAGFELFGTT